MTERTVKDDPLTDRLPLLPLKDVVVFPRMVVPLIVGRAASLAAIEESLATERPLFLCAQRDPSVEEPGQDDLYSVGVAANILQTLRMPDGTIKVVVEGMGRGKVRQLAPEDTHIKAVVRRLITYRESNKEYEALMRVALGQFEDYVRLTQRLSPEVVTTLRSTTDPDSLADLICAYLPLRVEERQELLEAEEPRERLEKISGFLMRENDMSELEQRVRERVREQMERSQREYYLQEQLKAIHQELGTREEGSDELGELFEMVDKAKMPKDVREKALRELNRYERMPALSPEAAVIRSYIEWLCDVPWSKSTKDFLDLEVVKTILDEDHYGLPKVKERILEYLAVRKLNRKSRGPILCFVGPPGVGKTSLGQSIARAMRRKFVRVSLGGVRDEAEIRGHRRTYIGALPGRIIQSMKRVGVRNPVFMLDEIDKMSMDFRGDPSSALLEVLDPEQNRNFSDHYLEVDFDLHEVFFIATANNEYEIPHALHDRLEIVRISGYTHHEKEKIARMFLIPKQTREAGLEERDIDITDEGLDVLIHRYTREAGVRELERRIANVCRKVARRIVTDGKGKQIVVDGARVAELLGPEEYPSLRAEIEPQEGLAVGLAWTSAGGDILHIETSVTRGKGQLTLTGQLGDVMKESAHAAYTYLRAHAKELGISDAFHKDKDLHIHVPEGAIPKDGPSAGIAIAVSMLSALRGKPPAGLLAMTGEITLRGRVLCVGGIKEKVLAAHRAGIRTVVLPEENMKDLYEIPEDTKKDLRFVPVENIGEALAVAFPAVKAKSKAKAKAKAKPRKAAAKS
jgi:ATP-dependent Lon protease